MIIYQIWTFCDDLGPLGNHKQKDIIFQACTFFYTNIFYYTTILIYIMASLDSDSSFSEFSIHSDVENLSIHESDISVSPVSTPNTSELSTSSDDEPVNSVVWHSRYLTQVDIVPFQKPSGPTNPLPREATEIDFFSQFFDDDMLQLVVRETNHYADSCISQHPDAKWYPTTVPEMKAYMGIMVVLSVMQVPTYTIAWGTSKLFSLPGIADIMTKNRFEKITKYLHVSDNTRNFPRGHPEHDKLHLVRPILDSVNQKCLKNYQPGRDQSIDEAMVAFRGRLSFRQYLPAKPTKFGIKVWMRASSASGYCHEFQVYTGRDVRGVPEAGLGARVVLDLTHHLYGAHHHVYMDNYFTSPALFQELLLHDVYACGTVRTNRRGLPAGMRDAVGVKEQGDAKTWQKGPLSATVWKDKKNVAFLYTSCSPTATTVVSRRQKDGSRRDVPCPLACADYTKNMGGVDRADQYRSQYSTTRKATKWWRYMFWFLFDVCIVNAYILMKESVNHTLVTRRGRPRKRTQLEFRMSLADQLISNFRGSRKRRLPPTVDESGLAHWPVWLEKRGRCKMCNERQVRHEVFVACSGCQIHLCIDKDCFRRYHQRLARHGGGNIE